MQPQTYQQAYQQTYTWQGNDRQANFQPKQRDYASQPMTHQPFQSKAPNVDTLERQISVVLGSGLVAYALLNRSQGMSSLFTGAIGAALVLHGQSRRSPFYNALNIDTAERPMFQPSTDGQNGHTARSAQRSLPSNTIEIERAVTVDKPASDLYNYWRKFENLPSFMEHLQEVKQNDNKRSHWVAKVSGGLPIAWDAEIIEDVPGERISWHTLPDSLVEQIGTVRFEPATGERGTVVHVDLKYSPPGGIVGETFARMLNGVTAQQVKDDIRRFKSLMEAGEVPTIEGQPSGRK